MDLMADLGPDEREVLAVFERYGQEGRAISTARLSGHEFMRRICSSTKISADDL
jgi:hypothetical protein